MDNNTTIPKIIHTVWLGGQGNKSEIVLKCEESRKRILSDYYHIEWTEDDFDLDNLLPNYMKTYYYRKKNYAYVSDFLRLYILINNPGIYVDTDMYFFKPFTHDMLTRDMFIGAERQGFLSSGVIGVKNKYEQDFYNLLNIYLEDIPNRKTKITYNTKYLTKYYKEKGFYRIKTNSVQQVGRMTIYSPDYFCPISIRPEVRPFITDNTMILDYWTSSAIYDDAVKDKMRSVFNSHQEEIDMLFRKYEGDNHG